MKALNNYISERLNPRNLGSSDTLPEALKEKYKLVYNPGTCRYDCKDTVIVQDDLIKNGHFICNFGIVKRNFNCYECDNLTSLKGAPKEVGKDFYCGGCKTLASLEGAPEKVGGDFNCGDCNKLTSLKGAPRNVKGRFYCGYCNNLVSLEGAPDKVGGDFDCSDCPQLTDYTINTKIGGNFIK